MNDLAAKIMLFGENRAEFGIKIVILQSKYNNYSILYFFRGACQNPL